MKILRRFFGEIESFRRRLDELQAGFSELKEGLHLIRESLGRIECRQLPRDKVRSLAETEFRVFSQWGDDGIIQYLINEIDVPTKTFIEFGVENYKESNTRFLLINNNWTGLVLDGSKTNIDFIRRDPIYWKHNLTAINSFITRENINDLIAKNGFGGEVGILSIDVDGNDFWIWDAITVVSPAIVICEYNSRFGPARAVTIPYDPGFVRGKAHFSHIYNGASLAALHRLATKKGYVFLGCNSSGNNAFFVRNDLLVNSLPKPTLAEGHVFGQFREARDKEGNLSFLSREEEQTILRELPVVEVT